MDLPIKQKDLREELSLNQPIIIFESDQRHKEKPPLIILWLTTMFQVLNSRLGARLALSSLLCPTFAFRSLLRPPISRSKPFAFGTESGYSSTKSELVITQRTMTAGADVGASPSWEDMWSGGLKKGDKWDRGVVSPALTHLLDSGKSIAEIDILMADATRGLDKVLLRYRERWLFHTFNVLYVHATEETYIP